MLIMFAPFLAPVVGIIAIVLGITLAQPKRAGELVPTWVWVILFIVNTTLAAGMMYIMLTALFLPFLNFDGYGAMAAMAVGFLLSAGFTPYLLSLRKKAVEDVDALGRPKTLEGRMAARHARVEKAKRDGKL